ncbi:MAG: hypothetical protein ABF537_07615, partial [Acetobacter sp.]|uniref:hypothetical protein n=1 Tax=Acetobacter sp. TaxID=440 RepID=UPI0039E996E1
FRDAVLNLKKVTHFLFDIINTYKIEIILSFLIFILMRKKSQFIKFLIVSSFVFGFESFLQFFSGVDVPVRSTYWVWYFFASLCYISIYIGYDRFIIRITSYFLSFFMILIGVKTWSGFYTHENKPAQYEYYLSDRIESTGATNIYACGDNKKVTSLSNRSYLTLRLSMWKQFGINISPGNDAICSYTDKNGWSDIQKVSKDTAIIRFPDGVLDVNAP